MNIHSPISSLFLLHFGANVGYAIAPLERLFYEAGLALANGKQEKVHFGYPDYTRGHPTPLPNDFDNLIQFDFHTASERDIRTLVNYVRDHAIQLVHLFDAQPTSHIYRPLREAGVKSILSYWGAMISGTAPAWKRSIKAVMFQVSRSKVDGLIFESQAMADLAIYGRGIPRAMIDIVPLGIDTTLFSPARSEYAHRVFGFDSHKRIVVYAGHMEGRKGVRVLIEAALELLTQGGRTDVAFLLFGNKEGESAVFERMYTGTKAEPNIRFGGYRSDLAQVYQSCFCGVIPSTGWDSFPRTSLEMAASGLPVVASRLQGLPEAVLHRKTGILFEPGNARQLAACIEELLDNPEVAMQYGKAGRLRCENELNLDHQRQHFIAVLRKRLEAAMD